MPRDCYVFDIDGTLADIGHRLHFIEHQPKNWDAFYGACHEDTPIPAACRLASDLSGAEEIVLLTGRPEAIRIETDLWIRARAMLLCSRLYMRADGDFRPDVVVKAELMEKLRDDGWRPLMVFEDRGAVVAMHRAKGIPCAQIGEDY
jgi:hypothetical protein